MISRNTKLNSPISNMNVYIFKKITKFRYLQLDKNQKIQIPFNLNRTKRTNRMKTPTSAEVKMFRIEGNTEQTQTKNKMPTTVSPKVMLQDICTFFANNEILEFSWLTKTIVITF